ncbi:maleylacetate reductase [Rhodoplanes sp. TEM]|uniref:Maleylacetate reductase n=1 Tax=Rhodoplanes tepidamans TaxID=200616 RepID=A0ABT5J6V5_RHOTP|nr:MULTISPECIES: maleylacetate reductase [Rhodoplanes]MDC7785387.1 maleylacetate reductase [Rhodoplanes tepidamans]MDC7984346.1 maleylacetate reductase [Rhodoplanes sp. TEM]MDQ0353160.1 alcohol dehydrogenase class IV [Rhodoplanes tepidamans]
MNRFVYASHPVRVVFGRGTVAAVPEEVERLRLSRVLIVTTRSSAATAEAVAKALGPRAAAIFPGAVMHTPVAVTETAMQLVAETGADGVVAIGGGSVTGLGKAIALRTDMPQIVVPTTYAGSEMSPILGETRDGQKVTQSSEAIRPEVVVYDVDLTLGLPPALSGTSGINALAHAVEALYAPDRNPIVALMAVEAIAALHRALPALVRDPRDVAARTDALYGAWLSGVCLGSVSMALHHKLCHTLGGSFDLPHAETHTAVLPHALAYNAPAVPEAMARLAGVLGADPARALWDLAGAVGAKRALADLGMPADGIALAAERALARPYPNPRPLERAAIAALIARAFAGEPPESI